MDDEDIMSIVLYHLAQDCTTSREWHKTFCILSLVSKDTKRLARLDLLWKNACRQRWQGRFESECWMREAKEAAAAAAASAAKARSPASTWLTHFRLREQEIVKEYPCFAMGGGLTLGSPIGLHLFEPRYRLLIATAMERDAKFVFAHRPPHVGDIVWLCECHHVSMHAHSKLRPPPLICVHARTR